VKATAATAERRAGGGRRGPSASSQPGRRLAIEAAVIAGLIGLGIFLVWEFGVQRIHNPRPVGGANVDVSRAPGVQSQAAVAVDPSDPRLLLEAANDDTVSVSTDGGRTWSRSAGPSTAIGACPHRSPHVAVDGAGREYIAFLAGKLCDDDLTSYVVVAERDSPAGRWHLSRVTHPLWSYGYDDGPSLAVTAGGTVYVAFQRSFSESRSSTVLSRSDDHGRTWSEPVAISRALVRPHLATVAAARRDVYVGGIDAKHGIWVARSSDGGRTFGEPRAVSRLAQNPAGSCSLASTSPVPREEQRCLGPDPAVVVHGDRVLVVWGDGGANGAGDVFAALLDRGLRPLGHVQVNPPDSRGASRQFMPAAAVDAGSGVWWACWYDTVYGGGNHAWFTCSASRNGRRWAAPERAASAASDPGALLGDGASYGFYPGLAAGGGVAHPVWIDTRRIELLEEVYTAALPERAALGR